MKAEAEVEAEVEVDLAAADAEDPQGATIAPRPVAEARGAGVAERQGEGETVRPAAPRQEGAAADVLQAVEDGGAQTARLEDLPLPLAVGRGAGRLRRWRTSTSGTNTKTRTRAVSCTPWHIGRLRGGLAQSRQPGKKRRRRKEGVVWGNRLTDVWESSSLADKQRSSTLPVPSLLQDAHVARRVAFQSGCGGTRVCHTSVLANEHWPTAFPYIGERGCHRNFSPSIRGYLWQGVANCCIGPLQGVHFPNV